MPTRLQVLVVPLLAATCGQAALASQGGNWQSPPPVESRILDEAIGYRVMLPESYSGNPWTEVETPGKRLHPASARRPHARAKHDVQRGG